MPPKKILNAKQISTIISRLSFQLIEDHNDFNQTALIAIQPRGVLFAKRILKMLNKKSIDVDLGILDITFFRDDFRRNQRSLKASRTDLNFSIENKTIVLIDDVLYTGRSIRAALDALQSYGRPSSVQLLNLIDRRFSRELPIQPDYCGIQVDSRMNQKVIVKWFENDNEDSVYLIRHND
ncbi:MAG: bifunctional pyr operon transcriptional regulator/uracil phosphoribosyltransferase [Flavobacteriales bacterium]|mgnify:FL=1|nr:bifunctional pyr operon transcriptional regulator/uracil phosphoribosyltransferase [Flavobacteriales bacterium]MBK56557.1 bifunctional pyr operon transcriptional regulator/uracil phosphoribosyltransferase [Flavobacteriaceae bacterium]|tara:strand:- start:336 stop:875 length:540 start_codon:yes stop_codon:yes gene_type:complete